MQFYLLDEPVHHVVFSQFLLRDLLDRHQKACRQMFSDKYLAKFAFAQQSAKKVPICNAFFRELFDEHRNYIFLLGSFSDGTAICPDNLRLFRSDVV